jgi:hypothetical protein
MSIYGKEIWAHERSWQFMPRSFLLMSAHEHLRQGAFGTQVLMAIYAKELSVHERS